MNPASSTVSVRRRQRSIDRHLMAHDITLSSRRLNWLILLVPCALSVILRLAGI